MKFGLILFTYRSDSYFLERNDGINYIDRLFMNYNDNSNRNYYSRINNGVVVLIAVAVFANMVELGVTRQ